LNSTTYGLASPLARTCSRYKKGRWLPQHANGPSSWRKYAVQGGGTPRVSHNERQRDCMILRCCLKTCAEWSTPAGFFKLFTDREVGRA
jgi:hypothetical protein